MYGLRVLGRVVLGLGLLLAGAGIALTAGAAIVAGDWFLAREPWVGIGMTLLVIGLAIIGLVGLLLDVIEPIGRVRLLAVPAAALAVVAWFTSSFAGLGGACCDQPDRDIRTLLYSQPQQLVLLILATNAILLPLAIARRRRRDRRR